jgi:hypothetical protein
VTEIPVPGVGPVELVFVCVGSEFYLLFVLRRPSRTQPAAVAPLFHSRHCCTVAMATNSFHALLSSVLADGWEAWRLDPQPQNA